VNLDDAGPAKLLSRLRALIDEARHCESPELPPRSLLMGLADIVPGVFCTFSELDLPTRRVLNQQEATQHPMHHDVEIYWRLQHQHPPCHHLSATGRLDVVQISDFVSSRQLRARQIYSELFRPQGVEHIIVLPLPTAPGRTRVFLFGRGPGRGFTEDERSALILLQPHLHQIYRRAAARRSPRSQLTRRQLDVVRCVALGMGTDEIAGRLFITTATVRKHLENVYARLGVTSRTAAVTRLFNDVDQPAKPLIDGGP
jgi:DNA-binding CsgD family transcriptional regulator